MDLVIGCNHSEALQSGLSSQLICHTLSENSVVVVEDLLAKDGMGSADDR